MSNNLVFFTLDRPAAEGSGKSIRLMNWLAHWSTIYKKIYCVYFQYRAASLHEEIKMLPGNIEFIIINPLHLGQTESIWRRFILGVFYPKLFNLNWYKGISAFHSAKIINALNQGSDVFFFRLYLFPVFDKYLQNFSKSSLIFLDLDDAESDTHLQILRSQWKIDIKGWILTKLSYNYIQFYEKSIQNKFNTLFYSNPKDQKMLENQFQNQQLQYFPNKVPYQSTPLNPTDENGVNILFCGSLSYFPNIDAIYFLLNDIWPIIQQKIPNARLIIAGNNPGRRLQKRIGQNKSVVLISNPMSMKDIFRSAMMLMVPLRIGGGTRIKILQAFSYGVPVVTTTIGTSGIEAIDNKSAIIRDTAKEIAEACILLIQDEENRKKIAKAGYQIFVNEHSISLNL